MLCLHDFFPIQLIVCRYIVSCGHDGEVRIWKGMDDDDPTIVTAGERAYSALVQVIKL